MNIGRALRDVNTIVLAILEIFLILYAKAIGHPGAPVWQFVLYWICLSEFLAMIGFMMVDFISFRKYKQGPWAGSVTLIKIADNYTIRIIYFNRPRNNRRGSFIVDIIKKSEQDTK